MCFCFFIMAEFRNIILKSEMPAEDTSRLMKIFDSLPLIFEGMFQKNKSLWLSNSDNPAIILTSKDGCYGRNAYVIEPDKDFMLKWYLDAYLINNQKKSAPDIHSSPYSFNDTRVCSTIEAGAFDNCSYLVDVFNLPK